MKKHLTKVGLVALVAVAALPVWASSGVVPQGQQQQEIEQRIQAEIARAMEELRAEMESLKAELAALSEERLRRIEVLEPHLETMVIDRERAREMAERAREMAQQAAENMRYDFRFEPRTGGIMSVRRFGGGYGEAVIDHAEELGLNDVQQQQIQDLQRENERSAIARRADIEVAEMDLEALEEDLDADITAVRSALEALSALRIDGQIADRELRRDVREVLTAEQREQFDKIWGPRRLPMSIAIRRSR